MRVFIDGEPIALAPGATVRHAILAFNRGSGREEEPRVFDPWGNEVGLDGELSEGDHLYTHTLPRASGSGTELA